ncbi:MAG TPA: hypothetical protein VGA67_02800 [Candidatus Dojkabacteria bacterium]
MKQEMDNIDLLIISDFVNELYVLTDKYAELVEKRSSYLNDEKCSWVSRVVDYVDNAIVRMTELVVKAEGFFEKGSYSLTEQCLNEVNDWAVAISTALMRLEDIIDRQEESIQ